MNVSKYRGNFQVFWNMLSITSVLLNFHERIKPNENPANAVIKMNNK